MVSAVFHSPRSSRTSSVVVKPSALAVPASSPAPTHAPGRDWQPFWLAETVSAQQWGIAALCLVYTASWWRGFRLLWLDQRSAAR